MSEHKAKIVRVQALSDGEIAFCARCCGDERTDSVLTTSVMVLDGGAWRPRTIDEHDALVGAHLARVERQHQAMLVARTVLQGYLAEGL